MSGILGIGLRGLIAYQAAMQTTAQNLENAKTPFYSRRQVTFVESMFNNGVQIRDVSRVFNEVSYKNLLESTSNLSAVNKLYEGLSDFEKSLDDGENNINKYINDSLKSLQELTTASGSIQSRGAYLAKLSSLATKIRSVGNDISSRKSNLNQSITSSVTHVNDVIKEIGNINQSLAKVAVGERDGLLDQRNALLNELATYVNIQTSTTPDSDTINVTLSNGLQLISGDTYQQFSVQNDNADISKLKLMVGSGNNISDATNLITGGQISGMLDLRNNALDNAERGLGRLALALSSVFNNQNKLGADLNGNLGGLIFADINSSDMLTSRVKSNLNNSGTAAMRVNIDDAGALSTSDYKLTFSDATHYTLTRIDDNKVMSSGAISTFPATISADGFTATIASGTFNAGDSYTIQPTKSAMQNISVIMSDPTQLALAFPVSASASASNGGTGKVNVDAILDTSNSAFSMPKQLNPPVNIQFLSDDTYQIVNANTNAVIEGPCHYDAGNTAVFPTAGGYDPGYRISLSGAMKSGDSFNINYNSNTSGDNRNALLFSNIYTDKVVKNGGLTLNDAYHFTSNAISMMMYSTKVGLDSAMVINKQAESRFAEISGVDEMEEVTNLAQYQQSYQASAQIIQVAKTMFDTILNLSR